MEDDLKRLAADDHNIPDRESAFEDLRGLGPQIEPVLRDSRRGATADKRVRIDWLLQWIGTNEIGDENVRRILLATRALEIIGTPHALDVRKRLVQTN